MNERPGLGSRKVRANVCKWVFRRVHPSAPAFSINSLDAFAIVRRYDPVMIILEHRTLTGERLDLEPLALRHREQLRYALDCDPDNWAIQLRSAMGEHFDGYWQTITEDPTRLVYVVRDRVSGATVGTSGYLQIDPANRTLEIGGTWFRPEYRGGYVNPEAKLLMLEHAFAAGAERVQFTVDARNARSRAAMRKLCAIEEGVLRRHKVTWTGHKRDSALFSIIADEWPIVRARLVSRLSDAHAARSSARNPAAG